MNLQKKNDELVKEFNSNQARINGFQQQMNVLQTRQIQIQGQLQMIKELEEEQKQKEGRKKK